MTDPNEILAADPVLGPVVDEHGPVQVAPADDLFARFVTSIIRQQLSMDAADTIRDRLIEQVELTPEGVLAAEPETLRSAGLSGQKTAYLRNVATAFQEQAYDRSTFDGVADEAVIDELTDITGVGAWTAKMFLLFCLGRPDVFPVEDLGIRKGMQELYGEIRRQAMVEQASRWQPYRSYASLYCWKLSD